jgi:membrane fusion protein, adhesin transport system
MLNISNNKVNDVEIIGKTKTFDIISNIHFNKIILWLLTIFLLVFLMCMFLPWTQNIQCKGFVTALHPDKRPQSIQSVIGGRIEKWYVKEGDFVNKGDTILFLSEVKSEYMDPGIVPRTEKQISAKEQSVSSYMEKVRALDAQIDALYKTQKLKIEQSENYIKQSLLKVQSDSINLMAAETEYSIAQKQYDRMEKLYNDGLKSLTDLETRKQKLQESLAKKISAENKLLVSKNEYINAVLEQTSIKNQYNEKLAKTESEKFESLSSMYNAEAEVTKMQTQLMNYSMRTGMYYITAPQDGYITRALKTGIGETVKEGEQLISIMPFDYELAVELYIEPVDFPLIEKEQHVRLVFDGWPNIVFSGWPNSSYGTFGGEVVAIDNFVSKNGKYRILIAKDDKDYSWPKELRIGAGAKGMALLKDVPVWYEIWRKLSGFPPDYYKNTLSSSEKIEEN